MKIYPLHKLHFTTQLQLKNYPYPIDIIYRVLSRKELLNLQNMFYKENSQNNYFKIKLVEQSLVNKNLINEMSDEQINFLYEKIIDISTTKQDDLELLEKLFWISQSDELSGDTWNCDKCKEKGLQEERNCPMITDKPKYIGVWFGEDYFFCPKYDLIKYNELIGSAFNAYSMFDKGVLPEAGGLYDQTNWFIDSAFTIKLLVSEKERKDMEKLNKD